MAVGGQPKTKFFEKSADEKQYDLIKMSFVLLSVFSVVIFPNMFMLLKISIVEFQLSERD